MPIFAGDLGENEDFNRALHEFERAYAIINRDGVRPEVQRRTINNVESRFIDILRQAGRADDRGLRWLVANRREFGIAWGRLDAIRARIGSARNAEFERHVEDLKAATTAADSVIDNAAAESAGRLCAKMAATQATAAGVTATGAAAFSFFGGPIVGGAATGATAAVSVAAGTAYTFKKYYDGKRVAKEGAEETIRREFRSAGAGR